MANNLFIQVPEPFFDKENESDSFNDLNKNNLRARSSQPALNRAKLNQSRRSSNSCVTSCPNCKYSLDRSIDSAVGHTRHNRHHKHHHHANCEIGWDNLGEKIEDWFEYAKTPDQKVVYKFLNDLEQGRNLESSFSDRASSATVAERAQSLEDILDNLKK